MSTESDGEKVFQATLKLCRDKISKGPAQKDVLASIEKQLEYLISVVSGANPDRSRLKDIVLAIYSVREFEDSDPKFADLLSQSDNYARILRSGPWSP